MTAQAISDPAQPAGLRERKKPAGLRERKKLATRKALALAAMRLAVQRGLDNVLVDDIAAAADVSPRTFSNYFASKYEAICSLAVDRADRIAAALRARPAAEPLWDALMHVVLAEYGPAQTPPSKEWVASWRLVTGSPALRGEYLKAQAEIQRSIAAAIAGRTGTNPAVDLFPRILAGAVTAACQAAMERWISADPPAALAPMIAAAMQQLADGMRAAIPAATPAAAVPHAARPAAGQRKAATPAKARPVTARPATAGPTC